MSGVCSEIIDDIEDLISSQDITPKERYASRKNVNVRSRKRNTHKDVEPMEKVILESVVPGTHIIYVKTWGCAHNNSDSEYMAGQLAAHGYTLTDDKWNAQLWLLNSCTVKSPAEEHFRNEIELGRSRGIHVVVAGCVPQGAPRASYLQGLSIVGVQQIDRIVEVVEETLKGHTVRLFGQKKTTDGRKAGGASLLLPKVRKNPLIEIISINTGCLNQCTYCKTKHARGELGSYPPEEIVERARQSFQEGVCEIWLTSEDTGTYGRDIGTSLPELLWKLVEVIPEGCRLRLGMTNPPYILEHLPEVAKIMAHPRVYKVVLWSTHLQHGMSENSGGPFSIHFPTPLLLSKFFSIILLNYPTGCSINLLALNILFLFKSLAMHSWFHVLMGRGDQLLSGGSHAFQSGSDQVLADMKREYTCADFEHVVDFLQERVHGITIATDIICGFPTETEKDFEDTMSLCRKYKFPSLFINQFFPRPGTPAAKMIRVPGPEVKRRTKILSEFFRSYEPYRHRVGEIQEVLVTDISHDKNYYVSHNECYEQVLVPKEEKYMGKMVTVEILSASKFSMMGRPIDKPKMPGLTEPLKKGEVSGVKTLAQWVGFKTKDTLFTV
ncbi:Threonylcarbamoyladenosine tRNA methylthiotransferase [Eumeta japonica]|uniref:Threonylcarbamoyladenosine tRNA methylthiotransferase n=1 Tax=Eumeta variegata TaxID=151549 RepID=A0A4C1U148_EUMVA|nr:Threonylcarbamoyladenosine tRNA methylthiotransferase [Eumeta japonica]